MPTFGPTAPTLDTDLRDAGASGLNYGVTTVGLIEWDGVNKGRTVWGWDVSSIPVGATPSAATLVLTMSAASGLATPVGAGIYPLTRAITEGTKNAGAAAAGEPTWGSYSHPTAWTTVGGDFDVTAKSAFTCAAGASGTVTIDVLTAVTKALSTYRFSGKIYLLGKRDTESGTSGQYRPYNREGTTAPTLTITYTAGTTRLTLTGAGT